MTGEYPEELVELLAGVFYDWSSVHCNSWSPNHDEGARAILDALSSAGRLVPEGSEVREEWGVRFTRSDGVVDDRSDASREAAEAWVAELQRQREHNQAPHGWAWTVDPSPIVRSRITTPWIPAESAQRTGVAAQEQDRTEEQG